MRLKRFMEAKNLNKNSLSKKIKVSASTVGEIESGEITEPRAKFFLALNREFPDLNLHWLLTGQGEMFLREAETAPPPDSIEVLVRNTYEIARRVEENTTKLLHNERKEVHEPAPRYAGNVIPIGPYIRTRIEKQRKNPVEHTLEKHPPPAATGAGGISEQMLQDMTTEKITVELPEKADYAIAVEGDSMEPLILDKSTVYYRKALWRDVKHGDLVVYFDMDKEELKLRKAVCSKNVCLLVAVNPGVEDVTEPGERTRLWGIVVYGDNVRR